MSQDISSKLSELDSILSSLRYVSFGDIIQPEDNNYKVDALKKIREILGLINDKLKNLQAGAAGGAFRSACGFNAIEFLYRACAMHGGDFCTARDNFTRFTEEVYGVGADHVFETKYVEGGGDDQVAAIFGVGKIGNSVMYADKDYLDRFPADPCRLVAAFLLSDYGAPAMTLFAFRLREISSSTPMPVAYWRISGNRGTFDFVLQVLADGRLRYVVGSYDIENNVFSSIDHEKVIEYDVSKRWCFVFMLSHAYQEYAHIYVLDEDLDIVFSEAIEEVITIDVDTVVHELYVAYKNSSQGYACYEIDWIYHVAHD